MYARLAMLDKELKSPKCGSEKRAKSGFNNKKQWYLCKECRCHYTVEQRGYPEHIRQKAIPLYLEGYGFRRIERILKDIVKQLEKPHAKHYQKTYEKEEFYANIA